MGRQLTLGRYPTFGEVLDYYARDDFLDFLLRMSSLRQVLLIVPKTPHWEPRVERDAIAAGSRADLRDRVRGRILSEHAGVSEEARLPFYPSFHQSLERYPQDGHARRRDSVLEADLSTWRASFQDMATLVEVLREEGVPHLLKFSGHRSLHVVVPEGGRDLHAWTFGGSRAHGTAILRMPYSLNEDTGLVSLPLTGEGLTTFRPWQASMHLVQIEDTWLRDLTEEERARAASFTAKEKQRESLPRRALADSDPTAPVPVLVTSAAARPPLWGRLSGEQPVTGEDLAQALESADVETRWLTAEALWRHGRELPSALLGPLLAETDEYLRPTAVDLLSRFPEVADGFFLEKMAEEELGAEARLLGRLAESTVLRDRVIAALRADPQRRGPVVLRLACVTGAVNEDWPGAWELLRTAEAEGVTAPHWETRVRALRLMAEATKDEWGPGPDRAVVRAIAALGPVIADLLLLAVGTPNRRRKRAYLLPLCQLADERALDVYVDTLRDLYRDNVRWATRALVKLGAPAVPALIEAAASDEARLRRYAIRCLGHLGDPRARETVLGALADSDLRVRWQAAMAARHYADEASLPVLLEAITNSDWETRRAVLDCLLALGTIGRAVVAGLAGGGEPVCAGLAWREGDARGRAALLTAAQGTGLEREAALLELAEGPPDAETIAIMGQALPEYQWRTQQVLAGALARSGDPQALAALFSLAQHEIPNYRKAAVTALGQWRHPEATAMLLRLLADPNRKVRAEAAGALVSQGEEVRALLEEAQRSGGYEQVKESLDMVLATLDLTRRLAQGGAIDATAMRMLGRCHPTAMETVSTHLRERGTEVELQAAVEACRNPRVSVAWFATQVLGKVGDKARSAIEEAMRTVDDARTREWLTRLQTDLDREAEQAGTQE